METLGWILRELVQTCVTVIDRRNPFSAHHSARVAEVSSAIAQSMHMDEAAVESCDIAGSLMNLGKVTVSSRLLTKIDKLTDTELAMVRASTLTSTELIEGVEFDGSVADTIQQNRERWDSSGQPDSLDQENILPTARVVAVANAFVSMVSARDYRPGCRLMKLPKPPCRAPARRMTGGLYLPFCIIGISRVAPAMGPFRDST